jgi:hypothetical protein
MTIGSLASQRVVDLLRYRRERQQQRLNFSAGAGQTPSLAAVTPFRPLSGREVTHRERMMRHLSRSR